MCTCLPSVHNSVLCACLCVCVDDCSFVSKPLIFVCMHMYASLCASYVSSRGLCLFCISVPGWVQVACLCLPMCESMCICSWGSLHRCDCMDLHMCI